MRAQGEVASSTSLCESALNILALAFHGRAAEGGHVCGIPFHQATLDQMDSARSEWDENLDLNTGLAPIWAMALI